MDIFWRMLLGHLLADFTLQTNFIAAWKRRSLWGLLTHVATHPVLYIALAWPALNETWFSMGGVSLNGWGSLVIIVVSHYIEDLWRIWSVTQHGAPDNFFFYLWDQVIHIVILFAVTPGALPLVKNKWPLLGCLAVLASHFTTISVYFVEKDLFGKEFPSTVQKYGLMTLRFGVFACLLLPGPWAWFFVAFLGLQAAAPRWWPALSFTKTGYVMGNSLVMASGLIGRFICFRI